MPGTDSRRVAGRGSAARAARAALLLLGVGLAACGAPGPRSAGEGVAPVDGWQRLDRSVVPRRYLLDLHVDPREPRFHGRVSIDVELSRSLDVIRMHAEDLEISAARIVQGGASVPARPAPGVNGGMALVAERAIPAGPARIEIEFEGTFASISHGLYRVEDRGRWYAFTQFQPLSARRAFPGFDQPEFKTPFRVKLRVPRQLLAVSSGPMVSRVTRGEERIYDFAETRPIPTYLLALAVGGFDVVPVAVPGDGRGGPVLRILTPAGRGNLTGFAAEKTPPILDWLVEWFGFPMPFAKLDQLAVPEFGFGAMENVGLVTYREPRLLLDPAHATARDRLWSEVTIAHEIAHMWLGNLVTLPWWDDLWLNESFASWMQTKVVDALDPQLEAGLESAAHTQYIMYLDSKRDARAVRQPIRTGGDVYNAFDGITYGKGAALLRMVEAWIGEATFQEAVRGYLDDHAYGSGGTPELLAALERASGKPVTRVVGDFLDRPGTPLVSARLECRQGELWPATLQLEQRRYLPAGRADDPDASAWTFPVCVRFSSSAGNGNGGDGPGGAAGEPTCFLLEAARQEIRLPTEHCPAWVHPNADEGGYYRWALAEPELMSLVSEHLSSLTIRERLALPGSLRALLEAGEISVEAYLEGLLALSSDPHRRMAEAIAPGLSGLSRIVEEADVEPFARFVRRALGPYLERIGLVPRDGEPRDAALLRSRLVRPLADFGRDEAIRARARAAADALLDGDTAAFTAEELRVLVPIGSWDAGPSHWERLRAALDDTDSPALRRSLVAALGSFDDPDLVIRSLELVLDGTLRAAEWGHVAGAIRPRARPGVWAWVERSHDAIVARLGPPRAAGLPGLAARFCTQREHDAVKAFFQRQPPLPGRARQLALALEDVERCNGARESLGGPMRRWLAALPE